MKNRIGIFRLSGSDDIMTKQLRLTALRSAILVAGIVLSACETTQAETPEPLPFTHEQTDQTFETAHGLSYAMHWDALQLPENLGDRTSTISATSYLADCGCAPAERPVMFIFNGGPGASSSPLHFALGPSARGDDDMAPNEHTLLDAADLVFIDPVETGFSRAADEEGQSKYLSVSGDADAVASYISAWITAHERSASPIFIIGQSYGGFRLTQLLSRLEGVEPRGLAMVSPMLDAGISASDMGYVFSLPTMAATAWREGQTDMPAESEEEAWAIARVFAETDYLLALQQGDNLPADAASEVAATLADLTGLEADAILDMDLRINTQFYLENVLAEENKLVSRLNTGNIVDKAPPTNAARPAAANDPSLGLGRSNKIISEDIADYLAERTGATLEDGYRSLNLDANFAWDWGAQGGRYQPVLTGLPALSRYLNGHPDVSLVVFGGYRDLTIPLLGLEYQLSHAGLPEDQVRLHPMLGGHSPFAEEEAHPHFTEALRSLILETLTQE